MKKKVLVISLLLLGIFLVTQQAALARMNFSRTLQGADRKVTELMILAMQARDAGDYGNAELFWMHARELKPSLQRPVWLDRPNDFSSLSISDDEVLRRIGALPYEKAKILLEEQLKKSPNNQKLRASYLELAEINADYAQQNRHASILAEKEHDSGAAVLRYVFFLIVLVLLIWQFWAFLHDFRQKKE